MTTAILLFPAAEIHCWHKPTWIVHDNEINPESTPWCTWCFSNNTLYSRSTHRQQTDSHVLCLSLVVRESCVFRIGVSVWWVSREELLWWNKKQAMKSASSKELIANTSCAHQCLDTSLLPTCIAAKRMNQATFVLLAHQNLPACCRTTAGWEPMNFVQPSVLYRAVSILKP